MASSSFGYTGSSSNTIGAVSRPLRTAAVLVRFSQLIEIVSKDTCNCFTSVCYLLNLRYSDVKESLVISYSVQSYGL